MTKIRLFALWGCSTFFLLLGLSRPVIEIAVNVQSVLKDAINQQPVVGLLLQERGFKLSEIAPKLPPLSKTRQSITSSVAKLYSIGSYTAATIILVFSVLFPIAKQLAFLMTLIMPWENTKKILHTVKTLHKWAMVDVFVLSMVVLTLSSAAAWSSTLLDGFYWFLCYFFSAGVMGYLLSRQAASEQATPTEDFNFRTSRANTPGMYRP
jgi:uncharacterized membrane protein